MVNRYAGEIHINPVRILRQDDFNNDGHIKDIESILAQAQELNQKISEQLQLIRQWLKKSNAANLQFHFTDAGYISVKGLSDSQLKELAAKGMIELFDFAREKGWVKKYGHQFGLIWEEGRAVEI